MALEMYLHEVGYCCGDQRRELTVTLARSPWDVWEVEIIDEEGKKVAQRFDNEADARREVEAIYAMGRKFGRWRIDRTSGYMPIVNGGPVSPTGIEQRRSE